MKKCVFLFCLFFVGFSANVLCREYNAADKAGRGALNILFAFTEIFQQPGVVANQKGEMIGFTAGVVKGFGCTIGRVLLGAYEVGTFFLPPYKPLVKPEFVIFDRTEEGQAVLSEP